MDMSKMGELMKFQQEAMRIKKELENTFIEAEINGLVITIDGEMKVQKVDFETDDLVPGLSVSQKKALQNAIMNAVNKGVKKSQETAQEKMKGIMEQMGISMPNGGLPM